jgi:hypothetical protein
MHRNTLYCHIACTATPRRKVHIMYTTGKQQSEEEDTKKEEEEEEEEVYV